MQTERVAFIGTGLMGEPMAGRVISAGYPLTVYNRTRERAESLETLGARAAGSPENAIKDAGVIILMLTGAAAIEEVLLSAASLPHLKNRTVIQMGTISPSQSLAFHSAVSSAGGEYLEAPVLGSIPEAKAGKLIVMVGATPEQFDLSKGLLKCFGTDPMRIGDVGQAAALKLALNQLIASLTSSFCLSLGFVQSNGIDPDLFMNILRQSALYAPTFDKKLKRFLDRDYSNPNFPSKHLAKDVKLFLDEAKRSGLNTSGLDGVYSLLEETLGKGLADTDYSAIFEAICHRVRRDQRE
jgi:3-hydroxyisobutyrate dehydrogenase